MYVAKILIIVEEPRVSLSLNSIITASVPNCEILLARSKLNAREFLQNQNIQLIILDEKNLDLVRFIRLECEKNKNTKLLLLTEMGKGFFKSTPEKIPIDYFINIPFSQNEFRKLFLRIFDGIEKKMPLGLKPEQGIKKAQLIIMEFRKSVDAQCVFVSDINGSVLFKDGQIDRMEISVIATLLSGGIATMGEAGKKIDGGEDSDNFTYHEGMNYSMYALNIGREHILNIIMNKTNGNNKVGIIWFYAKPLSLKLAQTLLESDDLQDKTSMENEINKYMLGELDKVFSASQYLEGR